MLTTLVIRNEAAELRRMSEWLVRHCAAAAIPDDPVQRLEVCANEALANIISYAYQEDGAHTIRLELWAADGGVRLTVRDDGQPFNPLQAPDHQQPASLDEAQIGGLGIHLMRRLLTRWEYRRDSGCNVLCMSITPVGEAHA